MIGILDITKINDGLYNYNTKLYNSLKEVCRDRYRDIMVLKISTLPIGSITDEELMVTEYTYRGEIYKTVDGVTTARQKDIDNGITPANIDTNSDVVNIWYYNNESYTSLQAAKIAMRDDVVSIHTNPLKDTIGDKLRDVVLDIYNLFKSYYLFDLDYGKSSGYVEGCVNEFSDKPYNPLNIVEWSSKYLGIDYNDSLKDTLIDPTFKIIDLTNKG
jgi:hypothetical protein